MIFSFLYYIIKLNKNKIILVSLLADAMAVALLFSEKVILSR